MLQLSAEHRAFDGKVSFYTYPSEACASPMRFAVFEPPQAKRQPVPVLYFLAGLTCTEETFFIKGGALAFAARHGLMLVAPDTSPRATGIPGEDADWDFGTGAGFYVDATEEPWAKHYRMYSYVTEELPTLIAANFPADTSRQGIFGHSMGGHGALVIALKNPGRYRSVSAFAPIAAPAQVPWGHKAFGAYLGDNREQWRTYDASELVCEAPFPGTILIDQGLADQFLSEQLRPEVFEQACVAANQPLTLRRHTGYNHSYFFVSSFMEDHIRHHAAACG